MVPAYQKRRETDYHKIRFNGEINLGNVIALVVVMITLFSLFTKAEHRFTVLETKVDTLWNVFSTRAAN